MRLFSVEHANDLRQYLYVYILARYGFGSLLYTYTPCMCVAWCTVQKYSWREKKKKKLCSRHAYMRLILRCCCCCFVSRSNELGSMHCSYRAKELHILHTLADYMYCACRAVCVRVYMWCLRFIYSLSFVHSFVRLPVVASNGNYIIHTTL